MAAIYSALLATRAANSTPPSPPPPPPPPTPASTMSAHDELTPPHIDPLLDSVSPTPELSETSAASPSDPLTTGIKALLDPTIQRTTEKLSQVYLAQQELSGELERLVSQLQRYLDTTDPPSLRGTVVKLAGTTKRLAAVNNSLLLLQNRINRIYLQLSKQRIPQS